MKHLGRAFALVLALCTLAGCKVDSRLSADETAAPSPQSGVDPAGARVRVLDATSNTEWVYFDLASNSVVYPSDPEHSADWDIAFRRFLIKVNGGISGQGNVAVAALANTDFTAVTAQAATVQTAAVDTDALTYYTDRALRDLSNAELISLDAGEFFPVCAEGIDCINETTGTVNRARLNPDTQAYVFLTRGSGRTVSSSGNSAILGWYDYYPEEGHILRPAGDTWVVRTGEGLVIKLELLGYYGLNEDRESGTMAFRYQSLTPGFEIPEAGDGQLQVAVTADVAQGTAPLTVNFSAAASGGTATQWDWDFGDSQTGSSAQVAHVYQASGTYTARVTVRDNRGAQATGVQIIRVQAAAGNIAPSADAGADQTLLLGMGENQIQFNLDGSASSDSDGQIVSYVWAGTPDPDDQAQSQVTLGVGSHVFTLTVTDDQGDSADDQVTVTVNAPDNDAPQAVIATSVSAGAVPLAVQFTGSNSSDSDGSLVAWHWDFGDGASADVADPAHTYTTPGTYTASLTVTDDRGATATATATVQAQLVIPVSADTYVYEFLGNQSPSDATLVWNHESNHGTRALLDFDTLDAWLATLQSGQFTATLHLYHACERGGFVGACPGDADVDGPGGVATVTTDIKLQTGAWSEDDAGLVWGDIHEGTAYGNFSVASGAAGWIEVDVTAMVESWITAGSTGDGIVLTQEAYPVVRADNGSIAVLRWLSKEHADTAHHPFIEITVDAP